MKKLRFLLLAASGGLALAGEPPRRPANILFLLTDEFWHDCLGVAGRQIRGGVGG